MVDIVAGFLINSIPDGAINYNIRNNVVSGSHDFGWILPGNDC